METPSLTFKNPHPGIVVVDDFLANPMEHREFALNLEYEKKGSYGVRSKTPYPYVEYLNCFERLLGRNIKKETWFQGVNGCYQWCDKHQEVVYHVDQQDYAAIVYLTPNAPPSSGTSFWKSKHSRARMIGSNSNIDLTFGRGAHLKDPDQWNLVDQVGNVFNRLILFNGKYIHSATEYFGEDINDSRLFQIFFFHVE
tara:strand:- start:791 stop:1381 length:591 start_codon:yes stop_codon:yes gene_type:complete